MKVYKVVREWSSELKTGTSAIVDKGVYSMVYKLGKKTKAYPETAGLFVFKTESDAELFSSNNHSIFRPAILLCEAPKKRTQRIKVSTKSNDMAVHPEATN